MKIIVFTTLLMLPLCVLCQDSIANHYKIYSTSSKKQVPVYEIIKAMSKADALFFGEEHNDSTGHQLEYIY